MVADGDIFIVGQQRIVGAEELADARGVVDGGVEVSVIADLRGQLHLHIMDGNKAEAAGALVRGIRASAARSAVSWWRRTDQVSDPRPSDHSEIPARRPGGHRD